MKKVLFLLAASAFTFGTAANAQQEAQSSGSNFYKQSYMSRNSGSYDRGTSLITIGYGFPNSSINRSLWDNGFGPLYVKYEHGIIDEVGIGAYIGVAGAKWSTSHYKNTANTLGMGAMGFYHFNKLIPIKQLDVYVGAGFGFDLVRYKYDDNSPYPYNNSGTETNFDGDVIGKAGARWYFTPGFSVFLEAGYDGLSSVNTGISFRF